MLRSPRVALALTVLLSLAGTAPLSAQSHGSQPPAPAAAPQPAQTLVNTAVATAEAQRKNVLVYFSASWCGWCHRFATFLASPDAGKLMHDNFVIVRLDALESKDKAAQENPGADDLLKKMSGGVPTGIPFYFVLDGSGKKIGDSLIMPGHGNVGHPAEPDEVVAFVKQLETIAPRMTPAQRKEIGAYLDEMAGRKG
ncbi:MAG: thioredoxin family protein [Gemmatimonadetes bacterium]|nr:thioredoxin family protein [Gemmatimonadota bacterium]